MNNKQYLFGVDVGGTGIKLGFFDKAGVLIEKWEIPTDKSHNGNNILKDIAKTLENKICERNLSKDMLVGVGVGVPGSVDLEGVVYRCVNLGWEIFSVKDRLSRLTGLKVQVANDANAAALGEMWKGSGVGCSSLVMVTIGTGIGGGIIVGESVIVGADGSGGEIGHITVNCHESEKCNCGKKGCVEQYASATGMVNQARKLIKEGSFATRLENDEYLTAKKIVDFAKNGDELALRVLEIMGEALGLALSYATGLCNPQVIIIGGGVSAAGSIIKEAIEKNYRKYAFHTALNTPLIIAKLGNDAGIYGAARLLL